MWQWELYNLPSDPHILWLWTGHFLVTGHESLWIRDWLKRRWID